jgi:hypothetical protein
MRFNELSTEKTILDEAPVGMAKRLGNWALSKTAFKLKDRGQREQLKAAEANRIWQAVENTVGLKNVPIEKLQDIFVQQGYGRSGKEILSQFAKDKKAATAADTDPRSTEERWADVEKGHKENQEAIQRMKDKLASVKKSDELGDEWDWKEDEKKDDEWDWKEDDVKESILREAGEPILLNKKEIEQLIKKVVWRAAETRSELFDREALRRQGKQGSEFRGEDRGATYEPEDSEPSVDYEKQDLNIDKEDLATRFASIKQKIKKDKKEDAIIEIEELEDFIDNL